MLFADNIDAIDTPQEINIPILLNANCINTVRNHNYHNFVNYIKKRKILNHTLLWALTCLDGRVRVASSLFPTTRISAVCETLAPCIFFKSRVLY